MKLLTISWQAVMQLIGFAVEIIKIITNKTHAEARGTQRAFIMHNS